MTVRIIDPANLIQALARGVPFEQRHRRDFEARVLGTIRTQPRDQIPDSQPAMYPAAI